MILHLLSRKPLIVKCHNILRGEGMTLLDTNQVNRADFEEFGRCIGLPEREIKQELDAFAKKNLIVKMLLERSFLSDVLKRQYWLTVDYTPKMLVW